MLKTYLNKLFSILLTVLFILASVSHVNAEPVNSKEDGNVPEVVILNQEQARQHMDAIRKGMSDAYSKGHDWKAVDNFLKHQGLKVIIPHGIADKDSSNNDVTIYQPSVAWDQWMGAYLIDGTWQWKRDTLGRPLWDADISTPGNVGGLDGAGLWWSNGTQVQMLNGGVAFITYDYYGSSNYYTTPWNCDQYGVVFEEQDTASYATAPGGFNYTWDSGSIEAWVRVSGTGPTYLKTSLGHDWDVASVSGVNIGTSGINFTFTDTIHSWQGASGPKSWSW